MSVNLIGEDIKLFRKRYDEALLMQGVPVTYQYPLKPDVNAEGESVVDAYSEYVPTHIFFDGNPKVKTFKRYGWVVENSDDLPFLIHCSFNLPHVQKDSLFRISGQYSELPDRIFRVKEITYDLQCADHLICQVIPVYDEKQPTGYTKKEVEKKFNTSSHFIQQNVDYRGNHYRTAQDAGNTFSTSDDAK